MAAFHETCHIFCHTFWQNTSDTYVYPPSRPFSSFIPIFSVPLRKLHRQRFQINNFVHENISIWRFDETFDYI